jgi:uncharacterized protein (TIGR02677 family)
MPEKEIEVGGWTGRDERRPEPPLGPTSTHEEDNSAAVSYLVAERRGDYVAIMDVLEASIADLTPPELTRELAKAGMALGEDTVEERLDQLRTWGVVHASTDQSKVQRHSDLLARNWRYSPTVAGRHTHRFYNEFLRSAPAAREIPLTALAEVVRSLQVLHAWVGGDTSVDTRSAIARVFVQHDALDGGLLGAEDSLTGLVDRYDLDADHTSTLRQLLVDYATRVANELDDGSAQAFGLLEGLAPHFGDLAATAVEESEARELIQSGVVAGARGGRISDWEGISSWFDPSTGRAQRFIMRLVRALPGMHANLRRLHASSGALTGRARALSLAQACAANPSLAPELTLLALGDHPWRKLWCATEDDELRFTPTWANGPKAAVPELLRLTGRTGARGRVPAARDGEAARVEILARRAEERRAREAAEAEVLAASPGDTLSDAAGRVALDVLLAAVRSAPEGRMRTAVRGGVGATVYSVLDDDGLPVITSEKFCAWVPGRRLLFSRPGEARGEPPGVLSDPGERPAVVLGPSTLEGVA